MTKDEVLENLKKIALQQKEKEYITLKDLRQVPRLEYYVYYHFGKIGNALESAGLSSSKLAASMKITSEDLLNYLADLKNNLGHNPTVWDINRDKEIYKKYSDKKFTWAILKSRFGGLKKALEQTEKIYKKNTPSPPPLFS